MRSLKQWPGFWIASAWVVWPALLALASAAVLAFILGVAGKTGDAVHVSLSVHVERPGIWPLTAVAFGPPLLLTAAWLAQRLGGRRPPPA